jgi:nucleolar protein 58
LYLTCTHLERKLSDTKKFKKLEATDIHDALFADSNAATSNLELVSFQAFADTADAVAAIAACQEGRAGTVLQQFLAKRLKKLLKTTKANGKKLQLAVADKALAVSLQQGEGQSSTWPDAVKLVNDDKTAELFRGIRCYMQELLGETSEGGGGGDHSLSAADVRKMQLGLAHALGRYKLKFSADKVDTMIIQAVGLLDELDKEINTYAMRVKVRYRYMASSFSVSLVMPQLNLS